MPDVTYYTPMSPHHKKLFLLNSEIKTPPISKEVRIEIGVLLRELQSGKTLSEPQSKSMPSIGRRFHELRITDYENNSIWRVIYRVDKNAILICYVFNKKTRKTPKKIIDLCKERAREYDNGQRKKK